ncbi:hypothetical protein [Pedobacter sp.]|uniref:hypothetical protein n=1 Tax=Pedobacter sp. TaxID=1411316 RepID=UPI003C6031EE
MRTGYILSYNQKAGIGLICDENDQRIKFFAEAVNIPITKGDKVSFEIIFQKGSLVATGLRRLSSTKEFSIR